MKILMADDEPTNLMVLVGMLKSIGTCETVSHGKDAVKAFEVSLKQNAHYDLILLDIMMPGMDGHETLASIRKLEQDYKVKPGDEIKVAIVSTLSDQKNVCKAFFGGNVSSYLTKPVNREELLKLVESV